MNKHTQPEQTIYEILLLQRQDHRVEDIATLLGLPIQEVKGILDGYFLQDNAEEPTEVTDGEPTEVTDGEPTEVTDDVTLEDYTFGLTDDDNIHEHGPRVLLLDIETSPAISYHWQRYKINVGVTQVIQRPYIITWSAKWLGSSEIMSDMLPLYPNFKDDPRDDKLLCIAMWRLLDEADIVIGHYIKKFDVPQLNTRFLVNGLAPPSPYNMICTKNMASKHFNFEANSLAELADHLGVGNKIATDFNTWRDCVEGFGTPEGWDTMLKYNEMDVICLENVYLKMRAYDTRHPNVSVYYPDSNKHCTVCGSDDLGELESRVYTSTSEFTAVRCAGCGHIARTRQNLRDRDQMKNTLSNIPT